MEQTFHCHPFKITWDERTFIYMELELEILTDQSMKARKVKDNP